MKQSVGLYLPKFRDKKTGELKESKIWWIRYSQGGDIKRESTGTTSKIQAKKKLDLRRGAVAEGKQISPKAERILIDELLHDVILDYELNNRKTLSGIILIKNKHLIPYFGGRRASSITESDIQQYTVARKESGALSATINRSLSLLRRAFVLGMRNRKINMRPHIELLKENNIRGGFFEEHEFELLCKFLPSDIEAIARFAYITGWRIPSEVMKLEWRNVDFKNDEVTLDIGSTKNEEPRLFPLNSDLREILTKQRRKADAMQRKYNSIERYVFFRDETPGSALVSEKGKTSHYYRDGWKKACKQAGLVGRIPHDLRRTAIRNFSNSGISEQIGMKLSGHKTASVYRRYRIVNPEDLRNAVRKIKVSSFTAKSLQSRT